MSDNIGHGLVLAGKENISSQDVVNASVMAGAVWKCNGIPVLLKTELVSLGLNMAQYMLCKLIL